MLQLERRLVIIIETGILAQHDKDDSHDFATCEWGFCEQIQLDLEKQEGILILLLHYYVRKKNIVWCTKWIMK